MGRVRRGEVASQSLKPLGNDPISQSARFIFENEELALRIDETVKQVRPDAWRGVGPRERIIKQALFGILNDVAEVERIFPILKAQSEY